MCVKMQKISIKVIYNFKTIFIKDFIYVKLRNSRILIYKLCGFYTQISLF